MKTMTIRFFMLNDPINCLESKFSEPLEFPIPRIGEMVGINGYDRGLKVVQVLYNYKLYSPEISVYMIPWE